MYSICRVLTVVCLWAAAATAAQAAVVFSAHLTGSQEVPPTTSSAYGDATLVLNDAQTALTFDITIYGLDFTGLQTASISDNLLAAHIHASPTSVPGVNGPVVFGFFGSPLNDNNPGDLVVTPFAAGAGGRVTGKWDAPEGNNTTLAAQLANLLADRAYLNFHTVAFGSGEIRGQIVRVPEPGVIALVGIGLAGLGLARKQRKT